MNTWADDERPTVSVRLPEALDADAAARLATEMLGLSGCRVAIDASGVQRMGALGLQVLLAARKTWASDGILLTLQDPSPPFEEAMRLFGDPWGGALQAGAADAV
jgi:chemotaxis protein CheX